MTAQTSQPGLIVRPLAPGDRAEWGALWQGYLAYYETELPQEAYERAFDRMLSGAQGEFCGLVAQKDGQLVGLTHYLFHRHGWREHPVCYLQDLYTLPEIRGAGVGRALIEAVYAAADQAGACDTYWLTQDFNTAARRLYDQLAGVTPFIKYSRNAT